MDFDELFKSIVLTQDSVLEQIDEYTLYCYYTNLNPLIPGKAYCAPYYRLDNYPSFSIFESNKSPRFEYMWKDHATGDKGNIFDLIQRVELLTSQKEVLARINEDFDLGFSTTNPIRKEKIIWYDKPDQNDIKIRIVDTPLTEKGNAFWSKLRIDKTRLDKFNAGQLSYFWTYEGQLAPTTAHDPTFYYRIGDYYQLYSPYADKRYKFRNDLPENYFFGYAQLPKNGPVLDLDKSSKDVIFCDRLGIPAVAGKSETTMIPAHKMLELKDRFETIYLTLDPDAAGKKMAEKYLALYPWLKERYLTQAKDKSDLCTKLGFEEAERIIKTQLLI